MPQEITLRGQNYYDIKNETLNGQESMLYIDPFLSEFTLMPRIQINFSQSFSIENVQIFLPELNKLGGRYNVEIIITNESEVKIYFQSAQRINSSLGATYLVEGKRSVILNGTSEETYNLQGSIKIA